MFTPSRQSRLRPVVAGLQRAIRFATYDWTREMPVSRRVVTMIGMGLQGYAIWAGLTRSLIWPVMWPSGVVLFPIVVLIVLDRASGELVYVEAGHNPPIVWGAGAPTFLEPTGTALGWFDDMSYAVGRLTIPPDGGLLIYTDGLPDSIPGDNPEDSLCRVLDGDLTRTMRDLKALVDPRFNEDDVTVLLVKRCVSEASNRRQGN